VKRAAIYARVSTDDQRDNYSILSQVAACVHYAEKRSYTIVGDQFVDVQTGRSVAVIDDDVVKAYVDDYTSRELSRPALDAAFEYLETIGYDVLIVYAIDRLARDPYIRQTLEKQLEKHGAKVEYVSGNYDDTPEGDVRKDLDATFAKWENAKRVERCNRGKMRKAERGLFVSGRAPYGYVIDKEAYGGLAVNEEQAEVVRRIFQMFVEENKSIRQVGETLTREGVQPPLGGKKWAKSSLHKLLKNSIYVGRGFYNRHKRIRGRLERNGRDQWVEYSTTPIVNQWLFDEAQRRLAENKKKRRRQPKRFYLMSGMVFCGKCERPYHAQTRPAGKRRRKNDAQSYRHRAKQGHCSNHEISARILEPIVWEELTKVFLEPERLERGYEDALAQQEKTTERQRAHLETLRLRAQNLDMMRHNLTAAYVDPEIAMAKAEYLEHKVKVEDDLSRVQREIRQIEKELANTPTPADLETFEAFASSIRAILTGPDAATPQVKRQVLETLRIKVYVFKENKELTIEGWFGSPIDGISYTTRSRCESQRPPPPRRA
jgi:site-specific DNA recombinase